jgi:hypothetical protein
LSWLNFFETKTQTKHPFGRGINANLAPDEEELFDKSYEAFDGGDILEGYQYFFTSLKNFTDGVANNNIHTHLSDNTLRFEIYQGTAKIIGHVTKKHLHAEVIITKKDNISVAIKRYILERNYQLTYAYYFSDDNYIKLKLYHDNTTVNPHKIFFPLREIALNGDFDKEYIKSEFPDVILEDINHLKELKDDELKIKYEFLHSWIEKIETKISNLPSNDSAGMQAFIYLNILLKIDYLLVPKYEIYQKITKKVHEYFNNENSKIEAKNEELRKYIFLLKEMSFEEFKTKFYNAKYSFSPTEKTSIEEINNFITESMLRIRWYKNNRYNQIIPTIYKYIAFYILYNYGLHPATKELLHTLVEIQNPEFFSKLNYTVLYDEESNTFSKRAIISKIEDSITPYQNRFKLLKPFGDKLNFTSLNEFSNSFYLQLKNLNFEEI